MRSMFLIVSVDGTGQEAKADKVRGEKVDRQKQRENGSSS